MSELDRSSGALRTGETAVTLRVAAARIYRALRLTSASPITPSQVSVLFRIEQTEPVRMGVLAHLERITPATLSKIVESLEALDLIEREPDPLDGRVTLLRISPGGQGFIASQRAASTLAIDHALAQLSGEHRDALTTALPALEALSEVMLDGSEEVG